VRDTPRLKHHHRGFRIFFSTDIKTPTDKEGQTTNMNKNGWRPSKSERAKRRQPSTPKSVLYGFIPHLLCLSTYLRVTQYDRSVRATVCGLHERPVSQPRTVIARRRRAAKERAGTATNIRRATLRRRRREKERTPQRRRERARKRKRWDGDEKSRVLNARRISFSLRPAKCTLEVLLT